MSDSFKKVKYGKEKALDGVLAYATPCRQEVQIKRWEVKFGWYLLKIKCLKTHLVLGSYCQ